MTQPKADHSLVFLKGYIYAIGSCVYTPPLSACERFDVLQNKWESIPNLNSVRAGVGLCVVDDKYIYAFGGRNNQQHIISEIEVYNADKGTEGQWKQIHYANIQGWIPAYMSLAH